MPIKYVADLCSNHNNNLYRLTELIETAKEIGCSAVKLQMYDERLGRTPEEKKKFGETKMPKEFVPYTYHKCKELGLELHCTPFHPDFVAFLKPYVDEFKIGSYELLWLELIRTCAETRIPINISCGGGTMDEINNACLTAQISLSNKLITLYHCIPHYPTNIRRTQLYKIIWLKYTFLNCNIGYSDHTGSLFTMLDAARMGARQMEFHLDLKDGNGQESYLGHCWKPDRVKDMIKITSSFNEITTAEDKIHYQIMRKGRTNPKDGMRGIQ